MTQKTRKFGSRPRKTEIAVAVLFICTTQASVITARQNQVDGVEAFTPGANCTFEGSYICVQDSKFQQCRWGQWSDIGSMEAGDNCDFHGQIGASASALMPAQAVDAPSDHQTTLNMALGALYQKKGKIDLPLRFSDLD